MNSLARLGIDEPAIPYLLGHIPLSDLPHLLRGKYIAAFDDSMHVRHWLQVMPVRSSDHGQNVLLAYF